MKLKLLCFGITKELLGGFESEITIENDFSVKGLKNSLANINPKFQKLNSLRIAVNEEYVDDDFVLTESQEVVLIPPVSGG